MNGCTPRDASPSHEASPTTFPGVQPQAGLGLIPPNGRPPTSLMQSPRRGDWLPRQHAPGRVSAQTSGGSRVPVPQETQRHWRMGRNAFQHIGLKAREGPIHSSGKSAKKKIRGQGMGWRDAVLIRIGGCTGSRSARRHTSRATRRTPVPIGCNSNASIARIATGPGSGVPSARGTGAVPENPRGGRHGCSGVSCRYDWR